MTVGEVKKQKISLFFVDDEPDILEIFNDFCKRDGSFEVETFNSVDQITSALESNICDALVTDMRMPQKDGVELLKWLRDNDILIPKIVAVSGFSAYKLDELKELGVTKTYPKPLDINDLLSYLKS